MLDAKLQTYINNLNTQDRSVQTEAYTALMAVTNQPVDWAYEVWDGLKEMLTHKDNHQRAIAAQLLCQLAKSDHEGRIFDDFAALIQVTRDERFVTARHSLQSLWKIGLAGERQEQLVLKGLEGRYLDCVEEKNSTLIRFDIVESMRKLYDAAPDERIKERALKLIELEEDLKYRKKYAGVWRKV